MRLLGVIWNSVEDKWSDVIKDIEQYGKVEKVYSIDFGNDFANFIKELYPFSPEELWKSEYKINGLINQYKDNIVHIVIIDIPQVKKVFLPQKNKDMYQNVLDMKVGIRRKYKYLIKENSFGTKNGVSYDNVFHMTDDEQEYNDNLLSVIPFLIKHNPNEGPLSLEYFVDKNDTVFEKNGSRKAYWLTPDLMFKEETDGTYESYSELFNSHLMKKLGLKNSCYYGLAEYNGKRGVITSNLAKGNDEKLILGSDIFNKYGIYDRKELIYYNSLDMLPIIIKKFCDDNDYVYNEDIEKEFEKLFMYDLITMQSDRNPSNWGIICNNKTRAISLSYFDHSNMLICDDSAAIEAFKEGQLDLLDYINNDITTFLIYDSNNIEMCHSSRMFHIQNFLEMANTNQREKFMNMLEMISIDMLIEVFAEIETENHCTLPTEFKRLIIQAFTFQKWQIERTIKQINKDRVKLLCKKN